MCKDPEIQRAVHYCGIRPNKKHIHQSAPTSTRALRSCKHANNVQPLYHQNITLTDITVKITNIEISYIVTIFKEAP